MKWIINEHPPDSGNYLVTMRFQREHGLDIVEYVAYYNDINKKWYKYDPFNISVPKQEIIHEIRAWASDLVGYIG